MAKQQGTTWDNPRVLEMPEVQAVSSNEVALQGVQSCKCAKWLAKPVKNMHAHCKVLLSHLHVKCRLCQHSVDTPYLQPNL